MHVDFEQQRARHVLVAAEVVENRPTARGYFELVVRAPAVAEGCRPGQFVHVQCSASGAPLLRRPLSVLRANPEANTISLLIQVAGEGTDLLSQATPGDTLSVLGPLGNWFVPFDCTRHVLVCGGVGVVPMLPLAQQLTQADAPEVVLLYGAASQDLFSCLEDFEATGCEVKLSTDDGSRGHHGFVTELLEEELAATPGPSEPRTPEKGPEAAGRSLTLAAGTEGGCAVYVCGPTPMMRRAADIAAAAGAPCLVSLENRMGCGMGVCLGCVVPLRGDSVKYRRVCREGPVFEATRIDWEAYPRV